VYPWESVSEIQSIKETTGKEIAGRPFMLSWRFDKADLVEIHDIDD